MTYRQLKTPNLDPVIVQGDTVLNDWLGWCLAYAQFAFNAPWAGRSAWEAWTKYVKFKHEDRNLPSGVYCLLWFDGYYAGGRYGHVVIYKDGTIWSAPYSHKATADVLHSIADVERIYGMKYVGWSEDIGGMKIIEQEEEVAETINLDTARILAAMAWARDGYDGRPDAHKGASDEDLKKNHVGKPLTNEYIRKHWFLAKEAAGAFAHKAAVYKERDALRKRVAELDAELKKTGPVDQTKAQALVKALVEAIEEASK